jgi:hypothetical protein
MPVYGCNNPVELEELTSRLREAVNDPSSVAAKSPDTRIQQYAVLKIVILAVVSITAIAAVAITAISMRAL